MALASVEAVAVLDGTIVGTVGVDNSDVRGGTIIRYSGAALATMTKVYDEAYAEEINTFPKGTVPPLRPVKPQVPMSGAVALAATGSTAPALGATVLGVESQTARTFAQRFLGVFPGEHIVGDAVDSWLPFRVSVRGGPL